MKSDPRSDFENEMREKGLLYRPFFLHNEEWIRRKTALEEFNKCGIRDMEKSMEYMKETVAAFGENSMIIPPFYVSQGSHTYIGSSFFANAGLTILDEADVLIGDHVFLGPGVSIFTPSHPIDAEVRNSGLQYAQSVIIEKNVWIGGNVTVNPGVVIGEGSVIGSGSVVTKNIPSAVVAAGNPCRVLRSITEQERTYWKTAYNSYITAVDSLQR